MAITYPLSFPSALPAAGLAFGAKSSVGMSQSPFTAEQQVYAHQGEYWLADISLAPMIRERAEAWVGFLLALNGREGTFLFGDHVNPSPRGVGTGTPLVKGASQTGKTLLTDGWTAGQTGIMKVGDWLQLGSGASSRLHKVVQDADSDGSGNATLEIWPRLRSSPDDNAVITVESPKGLWRLASNTRYWDMGAAQLYGIQFNCLEAL